MGRAKIAMEFITNEKSRNTKYAKRKEGLLKKGNELAILCDVPVCIIIYPYKKGTQSSEPEVYTFSQKTIAIPKGLTTKTDPKELAASIDWLRVKDPKPAREVIERYLGVPVEERLKKSLNLANMFQEWKRKANQDLSKLRHKNAMVKYPNMSSVIDGFTPEQLVGLLGSLDQKLGCVNQRINMIKGEKSGLEPINETATNNNANHAEYHHSHMEVYGQGPMFSYPVVSTSSHMQDNHQIGYFNPGYFPDQKGPMGYEHGGTSSSAIMYNYGMNMYYGYGPDVGEAPSYGTELPMPMPMPMPVPVPVPMLPKYSFPENYTSDVL